jgi:hypothetical protein
MQKLLGPDVLVIRHGANGIRALAVLFAVIGMVVAVGVTFSRRITDPVGLVVALGAALVLFAASFWILHMHPAVAATFDRARGEFMVLNTSIWPVPRVTKGKLSDIAGVSVETRNGTEGDVHYVVVLLVSGVTLALDREGASDRGATQSESERVRTFLEGRVP